MSGATPQAMGHIYANVIDPQQYGLTQQQVSQGTEPGSPLWWLNECCMQANPQNQRGLFSPECRTDEMAKMLISGACQMGSK